MTLIQQARDVLAKWREAVDKEAFESLLDANQDPETGYWDYAEPNPGAHLIFGTAGNPDLLDAIDALLADAQKALDDVDATGSGALASLINITGGGRHRNALRLAAAIIAADERMSA